MVNPTAYNLTFDERSGYLYANVQAKNIDRQSALSYLHEIAAKCTELKVRKLLLDRDIPVMLPDADLFFTTKEFLSLMGRIKVAFFNRHVPLRDDMDFAIVIAVNRGANFRVFDDAALAEAWLLP